MVYFSFLSYFPAGKASGSARDQVTTASNTIIGRLHPEMAERKEGDGGGPRCLDGLMGALSSEVLGY